MTALNEDDTKLQRILLWHSAALLQHVGARVLLKRGHLAMAGKEPFPAGGVQSLPVQYEVVVVCDPARSSGLQQNQEKGEGNEQTEKVVPLSIQVCGTDGGTEEVSFSSTEVGRTYRKSENNLDIFTYTFVEEDAGKIDNVEIGLDWSETGRNSIIFREKRAIFLKSLQVTIRKSQEKSLAKEKQASTEVATFLCNKVISDKEGRRARFFDNLGSVPVESLIWNTDEDFTRVIASIESGKVSSRVNANLDDILVSIEPQPSTRKKSKSFKVASPAKIEVDEDRKEEEEEKEVFVQVQEVVRQRNRRDSRIVRKLTLKRTVSLDMQLGQEARLLGFQPGGEGEDDDLRFDPTTLCRGLERVLAYCSDRRAISECLLGSLGGHNCLLVCAPGEQEEARKLVGYLSLLIENQDYSMEMTEKEDDESDTKDASGVIGEVYFSSVRYDASLRTEAKSVCSVVDTARLIQHSKEDWFMQEYDTFVVRKLILPSSVTKAEADTTSASGMMRTRKRRVFRETLISTMFSTLGGAFDTEAVLEIQKSSRTMVQVPEKVHDFILSFTHWIGGLENEDTSFIRSKVRFEVSDQRLDTLIQLTKVACYTAGRFLANFADAFAAISSTGLYLGNDFSSTLTGPDSCDSYFEEQTMQTQLWHLVFHFTVEENLESKLFAMGSLLHNQAWFQLQLSALDEKLRSQEDLLETLDYPVKKMVLKSDYDEGLQAKYGDKVRDLLHDTLSEDMTIMSEDIFMYLSNPDDEHSIGSLKDFKNEDCSLSMLNNEETRAKYSDVGILGIYVSDFEENQRKMIQIGDNIIEHIDAVKSLKKFEVSEQLLSLDVYKDHLWIDWPSLKVKFQELYSKASELAMSVLREAFEKWIGLRYRIYLLEYLALRVKILPVAHHYKEIAQIERLRKAYSKNITGEILQILIQALKDLTKLHSKKKKHSGFEGAQFDTLQSQTKELYKSVKVLDKRCKSKR